MAVKLSIFGLAAPGADAGGRRRQRPYRATPRLGNSRGGDRPGDPPGDPLHRRDRRRGRHPIRRRARIAGAMGTPSTFAPILAGPAAGLRLVAPVPSAIRSAGGQRVDANRAQVRQPGPGDDPNARGDWAAEMRAIAQRGDREAFARVFGYYAPRVRAFLARLGGRVEAEELAQEVMLTVWRRAASFDPAQASLATWIFTIARNRRIDMLRRARRAQLDPDDPALAPAAEPAAEEVVARNAWRARLGGLIATLPDEQGALLRRAFFEDKSHSAIAEELGLPLGTVKSRLRLAFGRMRRLVGRLD
jgi:RNA polymerase sigma-70 factor (ECF subfamily)